MHPQESVFNRIEAALHTLDATTEARIKAVDDRLRTLGVTVEAALSDPVDASGDTSLYLGYTRIAGRYCLAVKRVPRAAGEATVEPLHRADRATRIAVVDHLPALLEAVEAELKRRTAKIGEPAVAKVPHDRVVAAPPPAPAPARAEALPPTPPTLPTPEIAPSGVGNVDVPLRAAPKANATPPPTKATPAPTKAQVDAPSQDSVDHMFRLFHRKGK